MRGVTLVVAVVGCSSTHRDTRVNVAPPPSPAIVAVVPTPVEPEPDAQPDVPSGSEAARDAELAVRAATFIDAFLDMAPVWLPDGKRVLFVSNRDGLPQAYVGDVAKPGVAPIRLAITTERIGTERPELFGFATPTRDGKAVLFRSDKGGDELRE